MNIMEYDKKSDMYYQQLDWSKMTQDNPYKVSILKGDISCHKDYLSQIMDQLLLFDLVNIIIGYLYMELNFEVMIFINISNDNDSIATYRYNSYRIIFSIESYNIYLRYNNFQDKLYLSKITNISNKGIDFKIINNDVQNIINDCMYFGENHIEHLKINKKLINN